MYRILIIDDEPDVRDLYRSMLEDQGYDIVDVENGQDALALARKQVFDVFITDIMMPKMTGLDFIGRLRNIDPNAYVVIITGFDDISYNRKAIECGAWRYLVKPVGRNDIVTVVTQAVQERSKLPYPQGLERPEPPEPKLAPPPESAPEPAPEPYPQEEAQGEPEAAKPETRAETLGDLFDEDALSLLKRLYEHESPDAFSEMSEAFEKQVERPFRALFLYVMKHLPEALQQTLDTGEGCVRPVASSLPHGLMVNRYLSGAAVMQGGCADEAGQLFLALNHEVLQYGFTIGEYGDDSQLRFISHVREHIDDLRPLIQMLAESMSLGPMMVRLFELEVDPTPLITTQGDNLASLHVVVNLPLRERLDQPLSVLRRRIVQDFASLYPLMLLAEEDHPMASIRDYLGLPSDFSAPEPAPAPTPESDPAPTQPAEPVERPSRPWPEPARAAEPAPSQKPVMAIQSTYHPPQRIDDCDRPVDASWLRTLKRKGQALLVGPEKRCWQDAQCLAQALADEGGGFVESIVLHHSVRAEDLMTRWDDGAAFPGAIPLVCDAAAERSGACVLVLDGVDRLADPVALSGLLAVLDKRDHPLLLSRGAMRFTAPENLYLIATCENDAALPAGFHRHFARFETFYPIASLIDTLPEHLVDSLFPVIEELFELAPALDFSVFEVENLEDVIEEVWRYEVEPALSIWLEGDNLSKYSWEAVKTLFANSEPEPATETPQETLLLEEGETRPPMEV